MPENSSVLPERWVTVHSGVDREDCRPGLSERRTGSGPLPGPLLPVVLEVPIHVLAGPFARALLQRLIERLGPGAEASPAERFARPHAVVHQHATARHLLRLRYRVQVVRGF